MQYTDRTPRITNNHFLVCIPAIPHLNLLCLDALCNIWEVLRPDPSSFEGWWFTRFQLKCKFTGHIPHQVVIDTKDSDTTVGQWLWRERVARKWKLNSEDMLSCLIITYLLFELASARVSSCKTFFQTLCINYKELSNLYNTTVATASWSSK